MKLNILTMSEWEASLKSQVMMVQIKVPALELGLSYLSLRFQSWFP